MEKQHQSDYTEIEEDIRTLFPLEGEITPEIIAAGKACDASMCIDINDSTEAKKHR